MNHLKKYDTYEDILNEEVEMLGSEIDWENIEIKKTPEEIEQQYLMDLGKKGKLIKYIKKTGRTEELTFGLLKSLFSDAISYKKRREYTKGAYKFVHRAVPMALSFVWFPIWIIAQVLGGSRSINKVIIPALKLKNNKYRNFLINIVIKTMNIMEGEIKFAMGNDWFYSVFMVDWGLIKMIKKEHLLEFAHHVAEIMENEPDDKVAPIYYVENELKNFLNEKFNITPPMPLKE